MRRETEVEDIILTILKEAHDFGIKNYGEAPMGIEITHKQRNCLWSHPSFKNYLQGQYMNTFAGMEIIVRERD